MRDQLVSLLKRALVEQKVNALASRHLAFFVLSFATLPSAAFRSQTIAPLQLFQFLFEIHGGEIIGCRS